MIECFQPPATRLSEREKTITLCEQGHVSLLELDKHEMTSREQGRPYCLSSAAVLHARRRHIVPPRWGPIVIFLQSITLVAALQVLHVHFKVGDRVTKRRICWHFRISNPSFEFCGLAQWSDNGASRNAREYWHGAEKGRYWTCWRLSVRNDLFAKINFKVKLVMRKENDFKR